MRLKNRLNKRKIKNFNEGVVGIVVAVMLIGLLTSMVSLVQMIYVPKWMEQKESEHMDEVVAQFAQLKYAIDTHSSTKQKYNPISSSITLGSGELPYLMSVRSYGNLELVENSFKITVINNIDPDYSYPIGTIKYSSSNAYFIDQSYIYECGGVILSQAMGNTFYIKPSFSVRNEDNVDIYFNINNISTLAKKGSISGYTTYPIQTEFLDGSEKFTEIESIKSIIFTTNYVTSWHSFINGSLINAGLNHYGYGVDYSIDISDNEVILKFTDSKIINLYLNVIEIGAQIAPGWVENV
jgi:hypothetical protein